MVGGKEQVKMDEDGLGVSLVNIELTTDVSVTILEYDCTRRGYNCEIIINLGGNTGNARPLYRMSFFIF